MSRTLHKAGKHVARRNPHKYTITRTVKHEVLDAVNTGFTQLAGDAEFFERSDTTIVEEEVERGPTGDDLGVD